MPLLHSDSSVAAFPEVRGATRGNERFHRTYQPRFTRQQDRELRATVQNPGTIRRLWQNLAGYVGTSGPFSWTANGNIDDRSAPRSSGGPISTPLRYLITTLDVITAGNQRSMPMRRPQVPPRVAHPAPALVMAGNVGYRPTVRSRVPSYGSRVPALNAGFGIAGEE